MVRIRSGASSCTQRPHHGPRENPWGSSSDRPTATPAKKAPSSSMTWHRSSWHTRRCRRRSRAAGRRPWCRRTAAAAAHLPCSPPPGRPQRRSSMTWRTATSWLLTWTWKLMLTWRPWCSLLPPGGAGACA